MGKIHLEGADNARDLGGLKTTEGAVIREKKLIRSNRLSKLTQNDMNLLSNEYHLHKILDLRTPMEVEQEADLEIPEASYMNIPSVTYDFSCFCLSRYSVIYAWDELKELLDTNEDAARGKLLDEMCNYQGMKGMELIVVFDAYRVKGHETEITDYLNILVVYTKEAETADQYIEKFAHTHGRKYDVTVATSDGLEQIIIRGQGCRLLSARELKRKTKRNNFCTIQYYRRLL